VAVAPAVGAWTPHAHGAREGRVRGFWGRALRCLADSESPSQKKDAKSNFPIHGDSCPSGASVWLPGASGAHSSLLACSTCAFSPYFPISLRYALQLISRAHTDRAEVQSGLRPTTNQLQLG
jgi:hypothetical protein